MKAVECFQMTRLIRRAHLIFNFSRNNNLCIVDSLKNYEINTFRTRNYKYTNNW